MPADYQRLAQDADDASLGSPSLDPPSSSSSPRRISRRLQINLSALDDNFKRWTDAIGTRFKRKGRAGTGAGNADEKKEIAFSVFGRVGGEAGREGPVKTLDHAPPKTKEDFDELVHDIKSAIEEGIQPKMISKGSSGSYFARAKVDGQVRTVGVFKPKDEEPYGKMNPKLVKWMHRNFFWWIGWGRACLIPNLSYISEAGAHLLDQRLQLHIVPQTALAELASPSFYYDWIDRSGYRSGKPLPEKIGSLQRFMTGYKDASDFFRSHPLADSYDYESHRTGLTTRRFASALGVICGRAGNLDDYDAEVQDEQGGKVFSAGQGGGGGGGGAGEGGRASGFVWTQAMVGSFQEELERLIVLDYLMRNTDRGLDNFMIKYCEADHEKDVIDVAPSRFTGPQLPRSRTTTTTTTPGTTPQMGSTPQMRQSPFNMSSPSTSSSAAGESYLSTPHMHIAAIDNSLSFPHQHPKGWRSYTYGWLYLPVALIGKPFSERTRRQLLPLLSSPEWWAETRYQLRKLFAVDPDFNEKLFNRQMAVIKGQGWNIVQCLQHPDEGPLELTRRTKVLIWDDEVQVPVDATDDEILSTIASSTLKATPTKPPPQTRLRSISFANAHSLHRRSTSDFPPRLQRHASDTLPSRPVPFAGKYERVSSSYPGVTGVHVLEHLERLDAVERDLQRLGIDNTRTQPPAESSTPTTMQQPRLMEGLRSAPSLGLESTPPRASPVKGKQTTPRLARRASLGVNTLPVIQDEDPFLDPVDGADHRRTLSDAPPDIGGRVSSRSMDLSASDRRPLWKTVVRERLETVKSKDPWVLW